MFYCNCFFFVVLFIISELELSSNLTLSNLVEMYRKTDSNIIITYIKPFFLTVITHL